MNEANLDYHYFNYAALLAVWADVFGAENIILKNYDRHAFVGGDVRLDFLDVLGITDAEAFTFDLDANVSLDAKQLESLRLINRFLLGFGEGESGDYDLSQALRAIIEPHLPSGVPLKTLVDPQEIVLVQERFAAVNAEIEERFLSPGALSNWQSPPKAAPPDAAPAEPAALAAPSQEELAKTIVSLAQEILGLRRSLDEARALAIPAERRAEELAETIAGLAQEVHNQRLELAELHGRRERSFIRRVERRLRRMRRRLFGGRLP